MPAKQELFAMAFKVGAFKASKKKNKATKPKQRTGCPTGWTPPKPKHTKPKQRTGCPTGWTPPKPKPKETFSLFSYDIFHYHDAF